MSLAEDAKAVRDLASDLNDDDLKGELEQHERRLLIQALKVQRQADAQAQGWEDQQTRYRRRKKYDKAMKVARRRAIKKAAHAGTVTIVWPAFK